MKKTNRTFKRFAAITSASLLAACAVAPVAVSAADITIGSAGSPYVDDQATHTYEAYQIFTGTLSGGTLSNVDWGSGVDTSGILDAVKGITLNDGSTPFAGCTDAKSVAEVLSGKSDDSEIVKKFAAAAGEKLKANGATGTYDSDAKKITGLENGYYLVQDATAITGDGAKTRYLLDVAGSATVHVKSSYPTVMKKVYEETYSSNDTLDKWGATENYGLGKGYNDVADYDIGDDVPFKLYGTMPSGYADYDSYYYCFRDTLGSQFDAPNNITIKITRQEGDILLYYKWNDTDKKYEQYTDLTAEGALVTTVDDNCNVTFANGAFAVAFGDILKYEGVSSATEVIVSYTARLNETANVGYDGQVNGVYLEYSNNPNEEYGGDYDGTTDTEDNKPETGRTTDDGVIVFTYGFDINKVITGETTKLADAYFAVYYETEGADGQKIKNYIKTDAENCFDGLLTGKPTGKTVNGETTYTADNTAGIWKSNTTGNITILGLDKDKTYFIEELKAPATYNALPAPVAVTIASTFEDASIYQQEWTYSLAGNIQDGTMTAVDKIVVNDDDVENATGNDIGTVAIGNSKGSTLPGTGGIGTTIFYLGGGAMAAIGGVYLISKRRMKKSEE